MCVLCVVRSAPPSQGVVSARSIDMMNVLMGDTLGCPTKSPPYFFARSPT